MKTKNFEKIKPYTYFIKQKSTGLKYHGVRFANVKSGISPKNDFANKYFSSGMLQEDFRRNPNNFIWKLCWTFDTIDEARDYEVRVNKKIYKRNDWANNSAYPAIHHQFGFSDEHRKKLKEAKLGIKRPKEIGMKISKSNMGKKRSLETIEKIRIKNLGQTRSTESRKRMSESHKGQIPWNKGKIGVQVAWNKGLTKENNDIVKKYSDARIGQNVLSETRKKISNTLLGRESTFKIKMSKEEILYLYLDKKMPVKEIAKLYNCSLKTVYLNFKEFDISLQKIKNKR